MTTLKKYNLQGKKTGDVKVPKAFTDLEINEQLIKEYVVAIRANQRQWSASTKTRAEVSHTTKKATPQKGSGGARHSSLVAPQFKGGGIVGGPRPKFDQKVRINKKEKKAAIRYIISDKIKNDKIKLIDSTTMDAPKTKTLTSFIDKAKCQGRLLFLAETTINDNKEIKSDAHKNFQKSISNIQKTDFLLATNVNGYDLLKANELIVTEEGFNQLTQWLTKEGE